MISSLVDNWQQRPLSEKIILAFVATFVLISLLYLLVFDPLVSWRDQEQKRLTAKQRELTRVVSLVSRLQPNATSTESQQANLATLIDQSLQVNNLSMQGFQPGRNNDARLRLNNIAYEPLVQWLHDLEYKHNLSIEELTMSQTKTPGLLSVNIRIKQ